MQTKQKNYRRIIVEGNIGAGKSTFLRLLHDYFSAHFVFEPHEQWQNVGGHNLLNKFYHEPHRWAYTFQSYAFITRMMADEKARKNFPSDTYILERSVYSDRYCFAKNCYDMGIITDLEWNLYQEWFEWMIEIQSYIPDGFIYLRTDPSVCYERMVKRNRSEELTVSLEYLTMIHNKHEQWLVEKKDIPNYLKQVPVLVLECNTDFEFNQAEQLKHFAAIERFFTIPLLVNKKNNKSYSTGL